MAKDKESTKPLDVEVDWFAGKSAIITAQGIWRIGSRQAPQPRFAPHWAEDVP